MSAHADKLRKYLAEITRDRLGRFVRLTKLRACGDAGCTLPATDADQLLREHADFLSNLAGWLETDTGTRHELAALIDDFMTALNEDADATDWAAAQAHHYGQDAASRIEAAP